MGKRKMGYTASESPVHAKSYAESYVPKGSVMVAIALVAAAKALRGMVMRL